MRASARAVVRTFSSGAMRPSTMLRSGFTIRAGPEERPRGTDASAAPQVLESVDTEQRPAGDGAALGRHRRLVERAPAAGRLGGRQGREPEPHADGPAVDHPDRYGRAQRREPGGLDRAGHGRGQVHGHDRGGSGRGGVLVGAGEPFGRRPGGRDRTPVAQRLGRLGGGDLSLTDRSRPAFRGLVAYHPADRDLQGYDREPVPAGEVGRQIRGRVGDDRDRSSHKREVTTGPPACPEATSRPGTSGCRRAIRAARGGRTTRRRRPRGRRPRGRCRPSCPARGIRGRRPGGRPRRPSSRPAAPR